MNHEQFKPIIRSILEPYDFQVNEIPETDYSKQPDFEVVGKTDNYLIELKIKEDDPKEISEREEKLSKGDLATAVKRVGPRNKLYGIIESGVKQMVEFDKKNEYYKILWLHSTGPNSFLHFTNFYSTIFGEATLVSLRKSHTITCYYFHESAFYTWREQLDGAVLSYFNSDGLFLNLCINSLSKRSLPFRHSELVRSINGKFPKALTDPEFEQNTDGILIADCTIDRINQNEIIRYLQKKYCLDHLQFMQMLSMSATAQMLRE